MSEANRKLAERWMNEVWNDRRDETVTELLADGALGHMEGLEIRGAEEFLRARAGLLEAFPDMRIVIDAMIAEGDNVVMRWRVEGTHKGDSLGFPASGRPARFRGMSWFRFENGRLAEGWDAWNQGALIEQLRAA